MRQRYPLHIALFVLTICTTVLAGAEWATGKFWIWGDGELGWTDIWKGIPFSFAFLSFLTVHEFGHYFTALYHRVRCSLPYFIPVFLPLPTLNIGTFGAVIRIREVPSSRRKYFDIGVAGPLAGFVVALGMLLYGFLSLPPLEPTVLAIHPDYITVYGGLPSPEQFSAMEKPPMFGGSLLFEGLMWLFRDNPNLPPAEELMHYPFILAGFLGLFFTALNLLPIGQLDGGHVIYGLFGARRAGWVARITVCILLVFGGIGIFSREAFLPPPNESAWVWISWLLVTRVIYLGFLYMVVREMFKDRALVQQLLLVGTIVAIQCMASLIFQGAEPFLLWLIYAFMAVRVIKVDHPEALDDTQLRPFQKLLGVLAIIIFVLCFSPMPITSG